METKLAWLANKSPECLFEISQLAQFTEEIFGSSKRKCFRRLNKAVSFALDTGNSVVFPKLDKQKLSIIGCADPSFGSSPDLSSQLGHICLLGDHTGAVMPFF